MTSLFSPWTIATIPRGINKTRSRDCLGLQFRFIRVQELNLQFNLGNSVTSVYALLTQVLAQFPPQHHQLPPPLQTDH